MTDFLFCKPCHKWGYNFCSLLKVLSVSIVKSGEFCTVNINLSYNNSFRK